MIPADRCKAADPLERLLPGQCPCSTLGQYFVLHCTCAHGLVFRYRLRGATAGQESAIGCESIDVVFLSPSSPQDRSTASAADHCQPEFFRPSCMCDAFDQALHAEGLSLLWAEIWLRWHYARPPACSPRPRIRGG